ncbi:MAG: bleomycin resistance protein [Armatimonadetes bacterium]|nr:bleomycin resistance protein [Armatimonadota bacterium]
MKVEFKAVAPVLLVRSVALSAEFWREKVGFEVKLFGAPPHFAILSRGPVHMMLAKVPTMATITPNWKVADKTNDAYIWVSDAAALFEELCANGTPIDYTLYDTPWGTREFGIQDLDDHDITFGQVLENRG